MAGDGDHFDPWGPGKRGILRGFVWTAIILAVAWLLSRY